MDAKIEKNSTIIIDLWILFTLSGNTRNRSKVHTLCARKYSNGSLTRASLQSAISGFGTALESVFSSILILCKWLDNYIVIEDSIKLQNYKMRN